MRGDARHRRGEERKGQRRGKARAEARQRKVRGEARHGKARAEASLGKVRGELRKGPKRGEGKHGPRRCEARQGKGRREARELAWRASRGKASCRSESRQGKGSWCGDARQGCDDARGRPKGVYAYETFLVCSAKDFVNAPCWKRTTAAWTLTESLSNHHEEEIRHWKLGARTEQSARPVEDTGYAVKLGPEARDHRRYESESSRISDQV
jgi:hypothetical protein